MKPVLARRRSSNSPAALKTRVWTTMTKDERMRVIIGDSRDTFAS